jgi:hypothetical protein
MVSECIILEKMSIIDMEFYVNGEIVYNLPEDIKMKVLSGKFRYKWIKDTLYIEGYEFNGEIFKKSLKAWIINKMYKRRV